MQHNTTVTADGDVHVHTIMQGDTLPELAVPIYQNGEQLSVDDLSRVMFTFRDDNGIIFSKEASTEDDKLVYEWDDGDTEIPPNTYTGRFHARQGRDKITFPNTRRGIMVVINQ